MRTRLRVAIFLVSTALAVAGCAKEEAPPPETIRAIKTITIAERAAGFTRSYSGVVEPVDKSSLSFEVSGNVLEVLVDVGDEIEAGQVVATLDPQTFELDVTAAVANLRRARAQLTEKEAEYQRYKSVFEESPGAVSKSSVDQAEAAYKSARENVSVAASQLNLAKRDFEKTKLVAPFDAVIAKRHVEPFFEINRGDPIFDVFAEGEMRVATMIPETDIEGLFQGQSADITFPANPGQAYRGIVSEIGRLAGTANAFPVNVGILTRDNRLRPGMTAEVAFTLSSAESQQAFLIPFSALVAGEDQTKGYVFVYDPDSSTVSRRPVSGLGQVAGNQMMITGGLEGGEIIAVAGVSFLEDGQRVKLMTAQPTQR